MKSCWRGLMILLPVICTVWLTGCAPPGDSTTQASAGSTGATGCVAGQQQGSKFGSFLGTDLETFAQQAMPTQMKPYMGSAPSTAPAAMALLGSRIGCALNSQDQQKAVEAENVTTLTGQTQSWTGTQPGVSGQTQLVSNSDNCRTVQQTVTLADGTTQSQQMKSCKGPNGWEVASQ